MKIFNSLLFVFTFLSFRISYPQDTFSIDAVDPLTGEVGSAGASCISGCIILSDVHPGIGVIHTQASYVSQNQVYARNLMNMGLSPQQIIDSLVAHDYSNNPTIRQYGIVDLIGGGRTAAYTGINCTNYKNHIIGPTYTIQGNILLGQRILDSMQFRFLNTIGTLAQKLMAALQGAKIIGADTRCSSRNTSSISAFIRVAKPGDTTGTYYLALNVNSTPVGKDPIDSLQVLFNNWLTNLNENKTGIPDRFELFQNYPNPFNPQTLITYSLPENAYVKLKLFSNLGVEISTLTDEMQNPGSYKVQVSNDDLNLTSGIYYYRIEVNETSGAKKSYMETRKMAVIK